VGDRTSLVTSSQGVVAPKTLQIYILASRGLRSDLLAYALEGELSASCTVVGESWWFSSAQDNKTVAGVLLVDAEVKDPRSFLKEIEAHRVIRVSDFPIAFINLSYDLGIEASALKDGVVGFFYQDNGLDVLVRGIQTVVRGEVWMPRELLLECAIGSSRSAGTGDSPISTSLTSREHDVLLLVYMGKRNDEIAMQLSIAESTVKTHLYKLYKKIGVLNRLQAARWAAENLPLT
jgi:DNA-binding NarL/FixJ family response regulator